MISDVIAMVALIIGLVNILIYIKSNRLVQVSIENEFIRDINEHQKNIREIHVVMIPKLAKKAVDAIDKTEIKELEYYELLLNESIESYLNILDRACSNYFNGPINKKRFNDRFKDDICNIVEDDFFDGKHLKDTAYDNISRYYNKHKNKK